MAEQKKIPIKYRKARQGDAVALLRLLQEAYDEADSPYPKLDESRAMLWVVSTIAEGSVFVADLSGRVIGSIAMVPYRAPWSNQVFARNAWLYVIPNFRKEGTGRNLVKLAMDEAGAYGAGVVLETHSGSGHGWKNELLSGFEGMTYGGGIFFKPAEDDAGH